MEKQEILEQLKEILTKNGLIDSGTEPNKNIVETVELPAQFFIGVQFHPELKSRPTNPHPLFVAFVKAAKK